MRYLLLVLAFILPTITHAAPMFSEIAWMGTDEDANNEWIELYNFGTTETDLTGWTISDGDKLNITLSGTLGPHAVGLLERTDDTSMPAVTALMIYTGALVNTGATLTLKDPTGAVIDEVVGGENWSAIGGSNTIPRKTAQRTRTNTWVTGTPTPGAENAQVSEVVDEEEEAEGTLDESDDTEKTHTESTSNTSVKRSAGGGTQSKFTLSTAELALTFSLPSRVYVGKPVTLTALPSGIGKTITASLVYTWNFGDAYSDHGREVTHTFTQPGEYVVVLNATFSRHNETVEKVITVLPITLTISRTETNDIRLTNVGSESIDLSGYTLVGGKTLTFPPLSLLRGGKSLTIDRGRIDGAVGGTVVLRDTRNELAASTVPAPLLAASPVPVQVATTYKPFSAPSKIVAAAARPVSEVHTPTETATGTTVSPFAPAAAAATIPLYARAAGEESTDPESRSLLPYLGLVLVLGIGVLLLYTRFRSGSPQ